VFVFLLRNGGGPFTLHARISTDLNVPHLPPPISEPGWTTERTNSERVGPGGPTGRFLSLLSSKRTGNARPLDITIRIFFAPVAQRSSQKQLVKVHTHRWDRDPLRSRERTVLQLHFLVTMGLDLAPYSLPAPVGGINAFSFRRESDGLIGVPQPGWFFGALNESVACEPLVKIKILVKNRPPVRKPPRN